MAVDQEIIDRVLRHNRQATIMGNKPILSFTPDNGDPIVEFHGDGTWSTRENPAPSGETKQQFEGGATRGSDCDGVRYDLVPRVGLRRVAAVCARGAEVHGVDNWKKGIPIYNWVNHALTHLLAYLDGKETGEDDLAHATTNLMMAMDYDEKGWPRNQLPKDAQEA
jgi:hypothetical protein